MAGYERRRTRLQGTPKGTTKARHAHMSYEVSAVHAREILDSRARPTLEVWLKLASGVEATAGVPSGASTGTREAVELRDGDPKRFRGAGVTKAAGHVNGEINQLLSGRSWKSLEELDQAVIELDGTENKGRLGANATVGVSMAAARAMASADGQPLYRWLATDETLLRLPVPNFNVVNGGAHAQNDLEFQEFMLSPLGAPTFAEALRAGSEVYLALRALLHAKGHSTGLGDEGGFAPNLGTPEEVLDLLMEAIAAAGYTAGRDGIGIALDPASSEMRETDGTYRYSPGTRLTTQEMISKYEALTGAYPIWSVEDGLGEDDWEGWEKLTAQLGDRVQLVGDDIFVTNPSIIRQAISKKVGNSALIKLNQIGTVSETLQAIAVCRDAGYTQFVSHRSGETDDTFIADLAVASGCGQIKTGAPARGERVAKYNRLAGIEASVPALPYGLAERR
jgi:enolase